MSTKPNTTASPTAAVETGTDVSRPHSEAVLVEIEHYIDRRLAEVRPRYLRDKKERRHADYSCAGGQMDELLDLKNVLKRIRSEAPPLSVKYQV